MTGSPVARREVTAARLRRYAAVALAVAGSGAMAQMVVPPAEYRGTVAHKAAAAAARSAYLLLPLDAPAHRIVLAAPAAAERDAVMMRPQTAITPRAGAKRGRLPVGFARIVPAAASAVPLAGLPWQTGADGSGAARIALTSPGAAAIRLEIALVDAPPELTLRFQGSASGAPVYGPFDAATVARDGAYWSPALEGDTATVEFALPAGVRPGAAVALLPRLSHLEAAGRSLRAFGSGIGLAGICEVDVACVAPALRQQLASATNAAAKMMVTIDGNSYLCSGTLLNDSLTSFTPYFLTANHCLEDTADPEAGRGTAAAAANSINTYWFFQAATCGSLATPDYSLLVGGARLLARSVDADWALVQLKVPPPAGTTFAGWNAEAPISAGTGAVAIHHPYGDLKKVSQGHVVGYQDFPDHSSYIEVGWTSGVTEPGSSGGGLFTLNAAGSHFEVRGTLYGGDSACNDPQGTDVYGRFDAGYPLLTQYLAPAAANPAGTAPAVEYYNGVQDAYFLTVDPYEIAGRDNGSPPGWVRTGYRFLAYADAALAPAGAQPVCRLHSPPPYGDTRFYSASPAECAAMLAQPGQHFILEDAAAFRVAVPDAGGACPAGTRPVYRFLDTSSPPRRRYTAEVDLRDAMIDAGRWTLEGVGTTPDQVAMCAPLTGAAQPVGGDGNHQGAWWNADEPGWGINFAHQGNIIFATWFTYDGDGRPWWLTAELRRTSSGSYSGEVRTVIGPPFDSVPFDPTRVVETVVGTMTATFADPSHATIAYTVNGASATKAITPFTFGPLPTCVWGGTPDLGLATNYQDLWWNPQEAGWGVNFAHQGDLIFATWFTYDAAGKPWWLIAELNRTAGNVYAGAVSTSTGPPFGSVPWGQHVETGVGTATVSFADGNHATFAYTVNAVSRTKDITRIVFAPPGTVCQ
jgi:lysyl endopeptidase